MMRHPFERTEEHERQRKERERIDAYDDGLKGKPAASLEANYQKSYRRGVERRRELEDTE